MAEPTKPRLVCCIGDIHGFPTKLQNLWSNLESSIGTADFNTALIIFLGDYCDRGPNTREVIDFLISLPSKYPHQPPDGSEFAFAAFLGLVPQPPDGSEFAEAWKEYEENEEREGWYKGEGYENMHLQGRRWSGKIKAKFNVAKGMDYKGSIYDAAPTFESYGDDVCIETGDEIKHCKLIAVHAGLVSNQDVKEQLKFLKAKDTRVPKVDSLSGRKNVWDMPKVSTFFIMMQ
ncbi:hypothetical protein G4B88_030965 [Cannabis sativa]|uniref:Calcineurin-like phosphoesterase domain-containing protein n=1 Tax=Cannabis sativa TaxID=3483 RepID=A0A7J6GPR3_CANSA|nr:hypothetical protein G4B88_030965 [Cannabis sativa]